MSPLVSFFVKTRIGRDALYCGMPKNTFVICNTDDGVHYVANTSDKAIGRYIFKERLSYDSHHILHAISLINNEKSILLVCRCEYWNHRNIWNFKRPFQKVYCV